MLNKYKAISVEDLNKIVKNINGSIILKFQSDRCGPCIELGKDLENYNPEENINIIEIDVMKSKELSEKYGVRSIPHLVKVDQNLKVIDSKIGYSDFENFIMWLFN